MDGSVISKGKLFVGYAIAGIVFGLIAVGIMNLLAGVFSISFGTDLTNVFAMLFNLAQPIGIVFALVNLLVIGALVWIFGMIGAYLKSKVVGEKAEITKRPHLVSFIVLGVITVGIIGLFNQAIAGVSADASLTDINTLLGASGVFAIIASFFAYTVLGFIVIWLGSKGVKISEDKSPEFMKKV